MQRKSKLPVRQHVIISLIKNFLWKWPCEFASCVLLSHTLLFLWAVHNRNEILIFVSLWSWNSMSIKRSALDWRCKLIYKPHLIDSKPYRFNYFFKRFCFPIKTSKKFQTWLLLGWAIENYEAVKGSVA